MIFLEKEIELHEKVKVKLKTVDEFERMGFRIIHSTQTNVPQIQCPQTGQSIPTDLFYNLGEWIEAINYEGSNTLLSVPHDHIIKQEYCCDIRQDDGSYSKTDMTFFKGKRVNCVLKNDPDLMSKYDIPMSFSGRPVTVAFGNEMKVTSSGRSYYIYPEVIDNIDPHYFTLTHVPKNHKFLVKLKSLGALLANGWQTISENELDLENYDIGYVSKLNRIAARGNIYEVQKTPGKNIVKLLSGPGVEDGCEIFAHVQEIEKVILKKKKNIEKKKQKKKDYKLININGGNTDLFVFDNGTVRIDGSNNFDKYALVELLRILAEESGVISKEVV